MNSRIATIRVGIIGTRWGLMHLGGFRRAGAEIVALCGADLERTRRIAAAEGVACATNSSEELIDACDLVVVASPPDRHLEHCLAAIEHGRHVLCEKPIARSGTDALKLVTAALAHPRLVCAVNFPSRFLPPFQRLRKEIQPSGLKEYTHEMLHGFGRETIADDPLGPSAEFGGASHIVDLALWILGTEVRLQRAAYPDGPGSGIIMDLVSNCSTRVRLAQLAVEMKGSWGRWRGVDVGGEWSLEAGYVPDAGGWCLSALCRNDEELCPASTPQNGGADPWWLAHCAIAHAMLTAVRGGPHGDLATFQDGARVQVLLEESARHLRAAAL